MMEGTGVYVYGDGTMYSGKFKEDKRQGQGVIVGTQGMFKVVMEKDTVVDRKGPI